MRWLVLGCLVVVLCACIKNPAGTRCELTCRKELQCAERLEMTDVSYASCVQACTALERESETQRLVEEHIRCVADAQTCTATMECP